MFKLISHVLIFLIGAGVGVWWGVHHPTDAANIAANEQARIEQAVALAKQAVLQKVVADQSSAPQSSGTRATPQIAGSAAPVGTATDGHLGEYRQMLKTTQQQLDDAKSVLGEN